MPDLTFLDFGYMGTTFFVWLGLACAVAVAFSIFLNRGKEAQKKETLDILMDHKQMKTDQSLNLRKLINIANNSGVDSSLIKGELIKIEGEIEWLNECIREESRP